MSITRKTLATILTAAAAALTVSTVASAGPVPPGGGTLPGETDWHTVIEAEPDAANFVARPWDTCTQFPDLCNQPASVPISLLQHPAQTYQTALRVCQNSGGRLDISGPNRVELDTRNVGDLSSGWLCYDVDR